MSLMVIWLNELIIFDRKILKSYVNINFQQEYLIIFLISLILSTISLSTTVFIFAVDILCFFPSSFKSVSANICYCAPIMATNMFFLKICAMLLIMKQRFKWINHGIENLKHMSDEKSAFYYAIHTFDKNFQVMCLQEQQIHALEELRIKHYKIHCLTEEINSMFAFPILFSFIQLVLGFQNYSLYFIRVPSTMFAQKTTKLYSFFGKGIIAIYTGQLVAISYICSWLNYEAHRTGSILERFKHISNEIDEYIRFFLHQLLHTEVNITACNLFTINASLIFSVASAFTSYLVLCVQLHI
ncbi:putative gustatory receptor 28b [Diabrotica virgifera virgifera]|uniref:Gustatory receptor n=1 Tax=Diabrotica virgifera virgifera TaxID=50390 RepID=A0ABM5L9Q5_DIAVI|nr:putative gustatory receptor 28b [Diabrotica virgifera virgifera]